MTAPPTPLPPERPASEDGERLRGWAQLAGELFDQTVPELFLRAAAACDLVAAAAPLSPPLDPADRMTHQEVRQAWLRREDVAFWNGEQWMEPPPEEAHLTEADRMIPLGAVVIARPAAPAPVSPVEPPEPSEDALCDLESVLSRCDWVEVEGEPFQRTADLLNAALTEVRKRRAEVKSLRGKRRELLPEVPRPPAEEWARAVQNADRLADLPAATRPAPSDERFERCAGCDHARGIHVQGQRRCAIADCRCGAFVAPASPPSDPETTDESGKP